MSPVFDVERVGRLRRWRGPDWRVSGPGARGRLSLLRFRFGMSEPQPDGLSAAYTHLPNLEYKVLGVG